MIVSGGEKSSVERPRFPAWSTCFLSELFVEVLDDLAELGPQLVETLGERQLERFLVEVSPPLAATPWN
jgi:hypothetical protein